MNRHRLAAATLCIATLAIAGLVVYAGDRNRMSPEFREQFIEGFHRTGLNTTPGDAMMLRILVESSGAKRG
jgi:phosphomannomutase